MKYEKPLIVVEEGCAEGIYTASGSTLGCDSKYIKGVYHAPNYYSEENYISRFGCHGCPAFRDAGCGLQQEDYWLSYNVDNENRYPNWEKFGHTPTDPIDWNDAGYC